MQSVSDISKVIVEDTPVSNNNNDDDDFDERRPIYTKGNITLGISRDHSVHYDFFDGIQTRVKDDTLFLHNYHGKLLLPKFCGLQIVESKRIISGLINYPVYLDSSAHVNLLIEKTAGLEVLVSTMGVVNFNNKIIPKIVVGDPDHAPTLIGPDFEEYEERYTTRLELKKPKMVDSQYGTIADFGYLDNYEVIEVCMKFNLVTIYTEHGDMSILYEGYVPSHHRSDFKIQQSIRRSENNLRRAYQSEDYRRIHQITKKLERLYAAIGQNILKQKPSQEIEKVKHIGNTDTSYNAGSNPIPDGTSSSGLHNESP